MTRPLGDVCDIIAGQHIEAALYSDKPGGSPYLTGPADFGERYPIVSKWTHAPKVFGAKGDVLVTVKGAGVGKINMGCDAAIGRQLMAVRPKPGQLDQAYLYQCLLWVQARVSGLAQGATVPGIGKDDLANLRLYLPPLAEQKRIAAVLDKTDDLRAKRRHALATLDTLLQSVFLDMFGEPVKLPLSWKEHAKGNPGWTECTIGDQIALQRGKDITKSIARPGSVPVISSGGVSFFHDEAFARGPGVLLGRKGSVGNVHYVESDYWPHDTTLYVRDFKGNEPLFVYHFFRRFPIMQYEASAANPSLNRNNVHPVRVHWPSRELQRRFVSVVRSVERQKVTMARQFAGQDGLSASLQSAAFAGTLFADAGTSSVVVAKHAPRAGTA